MALGKKELWPQGPPPGGPAGSPPPQSKRPEPQATFTPVSFALVAISVALFLWGSFNRGIGAVGVLWGPAVAEGQWWRVFTSLVTHGGPLHLFFNLSVVWTVGRALEVVLGAARFLLVTLVTGLGSALFVLAFNFEVKTVGMSGAILGWVAVLLPIIQPAGRRQLVVWLVQVGLLSLIPGVSWAGHLGGFLAGLPLGLSLRFGRKAFAAALPVTAFVVGALTYLAGSGRFR